MCLAVPGRVISIAVEGGTDETSSLLRMGKVRFGGIIKEVSLAYVPEAQVGDYVIVHVGFAISRLDEREALRVFEYLRHMDELKELEEHAPASPEEGSGSKDGLIKAKDLTGGYTHDKS